MRIRIGIMIVKIRCRILDLLRGLHMLKRTGNNGRSIEKMEASVVLKMFPDCFGLPACADSGQTRPLVKFSLVSELRHAVNRHGPVSVTISTFVLDKLYEEKTHGTGNVCSLEYKDKV